TSGEMHCLEPRLILLQNEPAALLLSRVRTLVTRHSSRQLAWPLTQLVLTIALVSVVTFERVAPETGTRVISAPMAYDGESWFLLQRAYPTGRTPPVDALTRAMRDIRPGPNPRLALTLPGDRWVAIGPQPIYVPGTPSTTFSGRVTALAPHP